MRRSSHSCISPSAQRQAASRPTQRCWRPIHRPERSSPAFSKTSVSHDVHPQATGGLSPHKQGVRLWQARAARLWSAYLRLAAKSPQCSVTSSCCCSTSCFPAPVRIARQARRTVRATGLRRGAPSDSHEEPVLMRILASPRTTTTRRPRCWSTACRSARCRKSASRTARTTRVPALRHRMVPRAGAHSSPKQLDAVWSSTKSRCSSSIGSDDGPARVPPHLAQLSARDAELAGRQALGQGDHRLAARRPSGTDPVLRAPSIPCRAAFLTAPVQRAAILTADGVGEWATLTLGQGEIDAGTGAIGDPRASCAFRTRSGCSTRRSPPTSASR